MPSSQELMNIWDEHITFLDFSEVEFEKQFIEDRFLFEKLSSSSSEHFFPSEISSLLPKEVYTQDEIPDEEEVDRNFRKTLEALKFGTKISMENLFESEIRVNNELDEGNYTEGIIELSQLKSDQVVNRNIASNIRANKSWVKVEEFPQPAKSIKLFLIFNGEFRIDGKTFDLRNKPLIFPQNFLEPCTFQPEKDQPNFFFINKAKFIKGGKIGEIYSYMEQYFKIKTSRNKNHPFKKNLGLRVIVEFENRPCYVKDFPNLFTLDAHRSNWIPSGSPSRLKNVKRVREDLKESLSQLIIPNDDEIKDVDKLCKR